jgi:riboflavin kinase/FMN adenylyltransferase
LDPAQRPTPQDPALSGCAVTIGNFDGVHRGHQQIIAQTGLLAANTGGPTVVVTFEPHPLSVLRLNHAPPRLTPLNEKLACLADAGADVTVVVPADRELLSLTPEAFIDRVVTLLKPANFIEGASFGFGRGRSGTVETLRNLGARRGYEVFVVDSVKLQLDPGETVEVSSSLIRRQIAEGRVHRAALCLGRLYTLIGRVVEGRRRGATLGFPTANLDVGDQLVPADGVYAGFALLPSGSSSPSSEFLRAPAAISIGTTPTFTDADKPPESKIEAYLLDTDIDLYGENLRVEVGQWLRPQEKFDSAEALRIQISHDVEAVRRYTADAPPVAQTPSTKRRS